MIIAIDGLAANGKTTLAKRISKKLNYKNFSTGAIYRCFALEILNKKLDITNLKEIVKTLQDLDINFEDEKVLLNGEDVSKIIRTEEISIASNKWATIPEIKELVRKIQKDFLEKNNTVIEGRDICTRIAPNAEFKFYLYSDFDIRVERLKKLNASLEINEIIENLKRIDDVDINGGNFIKPENAFEIDTTNLSLDEVYNIMINQILNNIERDIE